MVQDEEPLKYDLFTKNKATKIENSTNWKHTFAICNTDLKVQPHYQKFIENKLQLEYIECTIWYQEF